MKVFNSTPAYFTQPTDDDGIGDSHCAYDNFADSSSMNTPILMVKSKAQLLELFDNEVIEPIEFADAASLFNVNQQRLALYDLQCYRIQQLYLSPAHIRPTYLVQALKPNFIEYHHFQLSEQLDRRGVSDVDEIRLLWQQLHVVDDLIRQLVSQMQPHRHVGWQVTAQTVNMNNILQLPTVGRLGSYPSVADQKSLNSYVLGHFGVFSSTDGMGYYIGHVLGYLFCCYYFAHLSINYAIKPLATNKVAEYDYVKVDTPKLVRLLQTLTGSSKRMIYQLAVLCAKLSVYASDKRIEKLLITEVNDFDKKQQQHYLDLLIHQGMMPSVYDSMIDIDNIDDSQDN